jgi:hypothetical protein
MIPAWADITNKDSLDDGPLQNLSTSPANRPGRRGPVHLGYQTKDVGKNLEKQERKCNSNKN